MSARSTDSGVYRGTSSRATTESGVRTAPFFDQGIFLVHLNRAKEEFRKGNYEEARRQFETAMKFRPNDAEVLSGLSLTLFHLGDLEDAERLTRGLLLVHPDSAPLLFNLGLILYKAGRDAEAREPLRRVVELSPAHRKAHLTLGLVLQRCGEHAEARQHFKLAGADSSSEGDGDDTVARTAKAAVRPVPPGQAPAPAVPAVKPENPVTTGVAAVLRSDRPAVAVTAPVAAASAVSVEPAPAVPEPVTAISTAKAPEAGLFTERPGGFLAAYCAGGVIVRKSAISGRTGTVLLSPEGYLKEPLAGLFAEGRGGGTLLLVDRGRAATRLTLDREFLSVDAFRLLVFESSLLYREDPAFEFRRHTGGPFLKLFGSGSLALAVHAAPGRFDVTPSEPLVLSARAVAAYGGDLLPEFLEEGSAADLGTGPAIRFVGTGYVLADGG